jgi:hypothetical protein
LAVHNFGGPGSFPEIISLPDGFRPEGIVSGYGTDFYACSLEDGSIYAGDLRTGEGDIPRAGQAHLPLLSFDERTGYLFVSGGPMGTARVYDTGTGMRLVFTSLPPAPPSERRVVTQDAAYFTDSFNPVLYKLPPANRRAARPTDFEILPLGGDFAMGPGFNVNGIEATPQGDALIIVQSGLGRLYRVDPHSGEATLIDLGGDSVSAGDGILLEGFSLYVVRNQLNQIAVVELTPNLASGSLAESITDPAFDAHHATAVWQFTAAVNARFNTPPAPDTEYAVAKVTCPNRAPRPPNPPFERLAGHYPPGRFL